MQQMFTLLNALQTPPPGLLDRLSSYLLTKDLKKKEHLLIEGQTCTNLYFIEKGLLRAYYIDNKGDEVTTWFMKEGDFICSVESFYEQIPSFENIIAIEPTTVHYISYQQMQALYRDFPAYNYHGRVLTEQYHVRFAKRMVAMIKKTAPERYQQLLEQEFYLLNRASQQDIASYLGMTPEMFSRIRGKIASSK
jgi:CRP-like cAMP-binding protein